MRCYRICNKYGISKFVYLTCATLITGGFIIQCILVHLVIVPYLSEANFKEASCLYAGSRASSLTRCENKCSKDRSIFPCLPIRVNYTSTDSTVSASGWIYDYYRTYRTFKSKRVSNIIINETCYFHFHSILNFNGSS